MAFDPIFRWLQDAIIPKNPGAPNFLQPVPCAYADDFTVAASSFRRLMTALSPAFKVVDHTAGLNLHHRKYYWVQYDEVETTALAHVACATRESGILLTDFAAAYTSVNHSWILHGLEKAELPMFICRFLRMMYCNSIAEVEFAGKTRGQFLMARGVRQSCSSKSLFVCNGVRPYLPMAP